MKTIEHLEQEAKQARKDAIDNYCEALKLFVVAANNAMTALSKICPLEVLNDTQSMESYIEDSLKKKLRRNEENASENYLHGDGSVESLQEASQEERDSDGWIVWNGGIKKLTRENVQVKFRNGEDNFGEVRDWNWKHERGEWDIIAYRIVK